ncbi:hypothetical protein TMatcc_005095, partial [Talaromyces marneffei ATCC 18224]
QDGLTIDQQLADSLDLSDDESLGEANIQLTSPILAPHPPPISIALINPPPAAIPIPTMPQRINSLTQV